MALIPEDRKTEGLMLPMSVRANLSFAALDRLSRYGIIDRAAERKAVEEMIKLLAIRTDGVDVPVGSLSGGNQQKVVIAKWLMVTPRIILLNDPTRGIDVGTKQEIYQLLRQLADAGAAIIFYSTDYDELIGCCNRVLVLYDGAVKRTLVEGEITERALVASALNIAADRRHRLGPRDAEHHERRLGSVQRLALSAGGAARDAAGGRHLPGHVRHLCQQPPGGLHRQCGADRRQQGRAAGAGGHGPDHGGADRRHRSLGRHDLHLHQLPRLLHRHRLDAHGRARAWSACCSPGSPAARSTG